jgi:hypothetical protein
MVPPVERWSSRAFLGEEELLTAVIRATISLSVLVSVLLGGATAGAEPPAVQPEEYTLYVMWRDGREDTRLKKLSDDVKVKKVAQSLGVSSKELQRVIDKVDPVMATLKDDVEKAVRAAMAQTPMAKRLISVELNTETEHVVALIKWRCGDPRDWDKEAAHIAWAAASGGPVTKILGLWCVNDLDTKLFSAKIGRPGMDRIDKNAIDRFASSRYIKLFEEVKRGPHT